MDYLTEIRATRNNVQIWVLCDDQLHETIRVWFGKGHLFQTVNEAAAFAISIGFTEDEKKGIPLSENPLTK
jgi:hypothetical protein